VNSPELDRTGAHRQRYRRRWLRSKRARAGAEHVGLEIDLLLPEYTDPTQAGLRQAFIENKFSGLMVGISRVEPAHLPLPSTLAMLVPLLPGDLWPRLLRSS